MSGGAFAAVRTTLVVLAPNNSGSTVLRNAIAASSGCWHLPREAQHVSGFAGPSTRGTGTRLIWAATPERIAQVADPEAYDWPRSWIAWTAAARSADPASPVMVLSSPPFLCLAESLAQALPDPRFVVLVRDPYAAAAGILKRGDQQDVATGEDIRELAARHMVVCLERQRKNIALLGDRAIGLSYEALCADPQAARRNILRIVSELGSLDLATPVSVKGLAPEPLRDMNARDIASLSARDHAVLDRVFAAHADTLGFFGYRCRA